MITDDEKKLLDTELQPHRRRLIGISLLPAAATLGNLLCGFAAILCCLFSVRADYAEFYSPLMKALFHTHIAAGAYLLLLAMLFDALDGRLARMTRRTSEFGAQLDSLSDIVSFGVAPAILLITLLLRPVADAVASDPEASRLQVRVGTIAALVYLSCAAVRLARFNAENVKGESAQHAFSGLPSPGAAAAIVSLLVLHEQLCRTGVAVWGVDWPAVSRWVIIGVTLSVGLLMVSRLDYVHVFNVYVSRRHPPTHLVWLILILGLLWYSFELPLFELLLVFLAFAYVISGIVVHFNRRRDEHLPKPD